MLHSKQFFPRAPVGSTSSTSLKTAMFTLLRTCVILTAFAYLSLASGCGQMGPLYMPGKPQPIEPKSTTRDDGQSSGSTAAPVSNSNSN